MARPENLQPGQINAAAQPVNAFIQPTQNQLAQPGGGPAGVSSPSSVQVVNTASASNVQGYNQFSALLAALSPFSKEAQKAATSAGLMYADWRMDQGEAQAMEAQQRALANVDQSVETGQLERAAANRKLAAKDPQAGYLMNFLDPYKQIGYERGMVKLAALEAPTGMKTYAASRAGEINYLAADGGHSALQQINADYIVQLKNKYGIDSGSPGFQKYFLPAMSRAQETLANQLAEDRVKYLDDQVPRQVAAQVKALFQGAINTQSVELDGQVYTARSGSNLFYSALQMRAQQLITQGLMTSGLPGQVSQRFKDLYTILQSDSVFYGEKQLRYLLDGIPSNSQRLDDKGRAIIDPRTKQPAVFTLGEMYGRENLDVRLKYEQQGAQLRQKELTDGLGGFRDMLARNLEGVPPGPQQQQVAAKLVNSYYTSDQNRLGAKIGLDELKKIAKDVVATSNEFLYTGDNVEATANFYEWLQGSKGSAFNEKEARQRQRAAANGIINPNERAQFLLRSDSEIKQAAKEEGSTASFRSSRDRAINRQIDIDMAREYPIKHKANSQDIEAGKALAQRRYIVAADASIQEWRAKYNADPTDAQVEEIVKGAIYNLRKNTDGIDRTLYPGGTSGGPSRRPQPVPAQPSGAPTPKVYEVNQLDDIPNRSVLLRQYESMPVLSLPAILDVMDMARDGRPLPVKFERAWRDAGAPNAYTFIRQQIERYPNYKDDYTPEELNRIRQRLLSQAAAVSSYVASRAISEQYPALAGIASWAQQIAFGA